jgi:hypothetical protein
MGYVIIFFDDDFNIKKAHESENYPTVKEIVYLLKLLEKSDLKDVESLKMDILTKEDFDNI